VWLYPVVLGADAILLCRRRLRNYDGIMLWNWIRNGKTGKETGLK
jgi:hypothetical protein